jgi:hypothetical protein
VDDDFAAARSVEDCLGIPNVSKHFLDGQAFEPFVVGANTYEAHHVVVSSDELTDEIASNVTISAGNEDSHRQLPCELG